MDHKLLPVFLSTILLIFSNGSNGQVPGTYISIEQAYVRTMSDNPDLEASYHEQAAAEAERKAAVGLRLPQVAVQGAYVHMGDDIGVSFNNLKKPVGNVVGGLGELGIIPDALLQQANQLLARDWKYTLLKQDFALIGGSATLPVYTGGKINAANRAARLNEQAVKETGEQTRNALVSQLVERYYGLKLAMQVVKVREQVVDAVRAHLEDAIALEENGMIPRADRLFIEVKMAEAERDLIAAKLNVETISSSLSTTLNTTMRYLPGSEMFFIGNIETLSYFHDAAMEHSPILRQVELQRGLAKENVVVKRSEYMPQVAAMGGFKIYRYNLSNVFPNWFVGAGFKINIFDGLSREYKLSAAKQTVKRVEALEVKAENEISLLVENLYNEMRNMHDRVPSLDKALEFAREYVRIQDVGFREGVVSATDVIDAELNLATTRIEKLTTAYSYDLLLAKLLEAAGISERFIYYATGPDVQLVTFNESE